MTTNKNLELWNRVSRVPPDQLKGFQRAGGFKGTAIKPMWSFHKMTEEFGPCGKGWGIGKPEFTPVQADSELLVYCTVGVWHGDPSNLVYGVGGDKVRAQFSSGLKNDDEAFKKAYTDALTNALKLIGVGADIHMGLWDGNKYVDEKPEPEVNKSEPEELAPKPQPYDANPIVRDAFKNLDVMLNRISESGTLEDLKALWNDNKETIKNLPAGWRKELEFKKDEIKLALTEKAA